MALLAAGDGHDLWVMVPVTDNQAQGFELLCRSTNSGLWRPAMHRADAAGGIGGDLVWNAPTMPRALALMGTPPGRPGPSSPYLLGEPTSDTAGWVWRFSLDSGQPQPESYLPRGHILKAAVGAADELFVVTLGPPVAAATQIGDSLHVNQWTPPATGRWPGVPASAPAGTASAPEPATSPNGAPLTTLPETAAATAPARAAAPTAAGAFNVYWLPPTSRVTTAPAADGLLQPAPGDWCLLAPLGPASDDAIASPAPSFPDRTGRTRGQPSGVLGRRPPFLRDSIPHPRLSQCPAALVRAPFHPPGPRGIPQRLAPFSFTLDRTLYLLWTVPNGTSLSLHGGWINTEGDAAPALHFIAPMPLDSAGTGLSVTDVAVGPSENAIVAVVNNHDSGPQTLVFNDRGDLLAKVAPIVPQGPRRDVQIGQNLALVVLVLLMTLMLWQWRQKRRSSRFPPAP